MKLRGQHGYAMVVLLVAMAVTAILATAAMPVWRQASQREKEAELVFRGEQYVRAIKLFSQRAGPGVLPPSVDVLVNQRFLRKKFKDPITGDDFDLLGPAQGGPAGPGTPGGRAGAQAQPGAGGRGPTASAPRTGGPTAGANPSGGAGSIIQGRGGPGAGGIIGVASKSKETSIRLYSGRTHYNEWPFVYLQQAQQPGATGPGPAGGDGAGRGGRGGNPPQRGGAPPPGGRSGLPPAGAPMPPAGPQPGPTRGRAGGPAR